MKRNLIFIYLAILFLSVYSSPIFSRMAKPSDRFEQYSGDNKIYDIRLIDPNLGERAEVEVKYFFNGSGTFAQIQVEIVGVTGEVLQNGTATEAIRSSGKEKLVVSIRRAFNVDHPYQSQKAIVKMFVFNGKDGRGEKIKFIDWSIGSKTPDVKKEFDLGIDWPAYNKYIPNNPTADDIKKAYSEAQKMIDRSNKESLKRAKQILDTIVLNDPGFVMAYHEIARHNLRTQWSSGGKENALRVLNNAIDIDSDVADLYILRGRVHTLLDNNELALKDFRKAKKIGTENLWLYTHWGRMLERQNKTKETIEKYKKVVNIERGYDRNDRAQHDAYWRLNKVYIRNKEYKKADKLLSKRDAVYNDNPCLKAHHSKFLIKYTDELERAKDLVLEAKKDNCEDKDIDATLAITHYASWVKYLELGEKRKAALEYGKAQTLSGDMLTIVSELADTDKTARIIKHLIKKGVPVDTDDSSGRTALTDGIYQKNIEKVERLIKYGADVNHRRHKYAWTPLMVAVLVSDSGIAALLLDHGADLEARGPNGVTALQVAVAKGDEKMINVLTKGEGI